jgi:hypothetical protein
MAVLYAPIFYVPKLNVFNTEVQLFRSFYSLIDNGKTGSRKRERESERERERD